MRVPPVEALRDLQEGGHCRCIPPHARKEKSEESQLTKSRHPLYLAAPCLYTLEFCRSEARPPPLRVGVEGMETQSPRKEPGTQLQGIPNEGGVGCKTNFPKTLKEDSFLNSRAFRRSPPTRARRPPASVSQCSIRRHTTPQNKQNSTFKRRLQWVDTSRRGKRRSERAAPRRRVLTQRRRLQLAPRQRCFARETQICRRLRFPPRIWAFLTAAVGGFTAGGSSALCHSAACALSACGSFGD